MEADKIDPTDSPWLDAHEAAGRAKCHVDTIYAAVRGGKLKASRLSRRRQLRIHREWIDAWIASRVVVVNPEAPGRPRALDGRP